MQLYIKNKSGEFELATEAELNEVFKEKSDLIVSKRISAIQEREVSKALEEAKPEFEKNLREELSAKIRGEVEEEFKSKLEEAEKTKGDLEIALRRKTVAAEFGFKPETEKFLGNGSEEDMRKEAETLKNSFSVPATQQLPEKQTSEPKSSTYEKTGLDIKI